MNNNPCTTGILKTALVRALDRMQLELSANYADGKLTVATRGATITSFLCAHSVRTFSAEIL